MQLQQIIWQARADSLVTGDRYVPALWDRVKDRWAVIDTQMEIVILSGVSFDVAYYHATGLSEHHRRAH